MNKFFIRPFMSAVSSKLNPSMIAPIISKPQIQFMFSTKTPKDPIYDGNKVESDRKSPEQCSSHKVTSTFANEKNQRPNQQLKGEEHRMREEADSKMSGEQRDPPMRDQGRDQAQMSRNEQKMQKSMQKDGMRSEMRNDMSRNDMSRNQEKERGENSWQRQTEQQGNPSSYSSSMNKKEDMGMSRTQASQWGQSIGMDSQAGMGKMGQMGQQQQQHQQKPSAPTPQSKLQQPQQQQQHQQEESYFSSTTIQKPMQQNRQQQQEPSRRENHHYMNKQGSESFQPKPTEATNSAYNNADPIKRNPGGRI